MSQELKRVKINGTVGANVVAPGDVVGDPKRAWVQSTAEEYIDSEIEKVKNWVSNTPVTDVSTLTQLPASGEANTLYRIAGTTSYSEYGWDGTQFVKLDEKEYGIDDVPTAGSENLVKSGGIVKNSNIIRFSGKNTELIRVPHNNFIKSHKYIIYLSTTTWNTANIVQSSGIFMVSSYDISETETRLVYVKNQNKQNLMSSYVIEIPDNSEHVDVAFRGDIGSTLYVSIIDITYSEEKLQGINCLNFVGTGDTRVFYETRTMLAGHTYNVYLNKNTWSVDEIIENNIVFGIYSYDSQDTETELVAYSQNIVGEFNKELSITVPNDSKNVFVLFRGNTGETLTITITDITYSYNNAELVNGNCFVGKNNEYISKPLYGIVPGQSYRLYLPVINWDRSGVTLPNSHLFSVISYDENNIATNLVVIRTSQTITQHIYDFMVPDNSQYITIGGRATFGEKVCWAISSLLVFDDEPTAGSDNLVNSSGIVKNSNIIRFSGKNTELIRVPHNIFIKNHKYIIYLSTTTWNTDNIKSSSGIFMVISYDISETETRLVYVKNQNKQNLMSSYVIEIPDNSEHVDVAFRGDIGSTLYVSIIDITYSNISLKDIRNDNDVVSLLKAFKHGRNVRNVRTPSFVMVHFSDLHGDENCFNRIESFATAHDNDIDLVLHTGDLVSNFYNHPIYWNHNPKFLLTTGNHDCSWRDDSVTPYVWRYVERDVVYTNLFAPYIDDWGVVRPENATTELYYYKDYGEDNDDLKVRLITLDPFYWDNNEAVWLETVLADAKASGRSIILASHYGPFKGEKDPTNPFDSLDYDTNNGMLETALPIVDTFISNGGEIVCWLVGHQHADGFRTQINYPGILVVAVSAGGKTPNQEYQRTVGTISEDLFNIYSIDTTKKILTIFRIGASYDDYGRYKGVLVYDYGNGQILKIN